LEEQVVQLAVVLVWVIPKLLPHRALIQDGLLMQMPVEQVQITMVLAAAVAAAELGLPEQLRQPLLQVQMFSPVRVAPQFIC
jgi:hypothetical protein